MKAFDTVKWSYQMMIMKKMHFLGKYLTLISLCISTASFFLNMNEALTGIFSATRGLR